MRDLAGLGLLTFLGVSAFLVFFIIAGTLFGAIGAWVVGYFFGDTILGILGQLGVHHVTMWQFGAFLGFVGGFFQPVTTRTNHD